MDKLAIYVHWPYCARICPYCDFNVYKGARNQKLVEAILQDLQAWRERSGPRAISSIHFGGGTPSLMTADDVRAVIHKVDELWGLPETAEIGLEANPNDAASSTWQALAAAGINRLSLGVQSFHDPALKLFGRDHDAKAARLALKLAADIFSNYSLDMIFGWAGQCEALLKEDLEIALSFNPPHISVYQLTIEPDTAFAKAEARGQARAVDVDSSADFYGLIQKRLTGAGYDHYEVSNYAKAGARSRHNLAYWQGVDYVGVGPGAHGRLTTDQARFATIAEMRPDDYIAAVEARGSGLSENTALSAEARADEYLLMGLRISEGISLTHYQGIAGHALPPARYEVFTEGGYLIHQDDRLYTTQLGRPVLDYILQKLIG